MKKKIFFRADGNSIIGLGHLYRSFALMEMLQDTFECTFITHENSTTTVIPASYNLILIPAKTSLAQEAHWLQKTLDTKGVFIADGYHFTSTYQKQIKQVGFNLIYIDDLTTEHFYADAVINHASIVSLEAIKKEIYTSYYFGTKYAMLRPLFLAQAAIKKSHIEPMHSVFVCFGGADAFNLTLKATQSLLTFRHIKHIHIVLGAAYTNTKIDSLELDNSSVVIHRNIEEAAMIEVMQSCQFAIAPASTILYELCCIKMPILSGYYVSNQKHIYRGLLAHQVIFDGGNFEHYTVSDFTQKLTKCFEQESNTLIRNQSVLFDASIQHRFKNIVLSLSEEYQIRNATKGDMILFFDWANEPVTRAMSFNSEPILLENHKQWFASQLEATDSHLLIMDVVQNNRKIPVGNVKFNSEGTIGISLDPRYRGKGLGPFLINQGLQFIAQNNPYPCIFAYIKEENTKSQTVFEQAGFVFSQKTRVGKTPCLEYTLTPSTL
jgi:UDP-2,4-diacetamido-2,4,6-trideoxy-beta-L-altropyranose hydrolase